MKCEAINKIQSFRFKLSDQTIKCASKSTKLTKEELMGLPFDRQAELAMQRGSLKTINPVKKFFSDLYKKFGENLGLLEKYSNTYSDID